MIKFDDVGFGFSLGCAWGTCVFMLSLASRASQRAERVVHLFAKVYRGFDETLLGGFIGAVWGFFDGVVSGLLIAWIYNTIIR